jgi:general secretion pathway protein E
MDTTTEITTALAVTEEFEVEYLRIYSILPLVIDEGLLVIATAGDPAAEVVADLVRTYGARGAVLRQVDADALENALRRCFAASESVVELVRGFESTGDDGDALLREELTDVRDLANQAPVVRYVNLLLREAHEAGASDIHLEATRTGLRARFRLDGVLTDLPAPPPEYQGAVVSRIKLLAGVDIAQRRAPQDGRIRVRLERRELDLRVSTVPTLHGESVVLRLLDRGGQPVTLAELGLPTAFLPAVDRLAKRPHGLFIATGPTGSGKTTTLYAALRLRNPVTEKIVTVEDPIEYDLPGVTQVPVRQGVSFADALRSILRQDPDILMIGEMRDGETARIAVQAAMTGHLVFSTLHTNDAESALTRLTELGIEPYLVAATVEGVLAQRLVRRICPDCREEYTPEGDALSWVAGADADLTPPPGGFLRGRGCPSCRETGYRGRMGLFELLTLRDGPRLPLSSTLEAVDPRSGRGGSAMGGLRAEGWRAIRAGLTTVEEVLRVVPA